METIRGYFSFRSPYSWLALHRVEAAFAALPVQLELFPTYPPPRFPNDPMLLPAKAAYIVRDVERFAIAYGLEFCWPQQFDTAWPRPHAAFVHADQAGCGLEFAKALFAARFSRGLDVASDETLCECAIACRLDPQQTLAAADDSELRAKMEDRMRASREQGRRFGVPTFVYQDELFWGNDRIEWLLRAVKQRLGQPVPELSEDPMLRPQG